LRTSRINTHPSTSVYNRWNR